MICSVILLIASLLVNTQHTYATFTNDQVNADINYGTFKDPSVHVRPKFRYWPNDASVNLTQVQDDVREAGRVGAGGIELLGYYFYGDLQLFPGNYDHLESDWTIYGFGSPAWKTLLDTVLSTAQEEGLVVDMALGPNQGAGVPAPFDSDGLLWDLNFYDISVPLGGSFFSVLPGWNSGPLVAASTGLVLNIASTSSGGSTITLSQNSLTDITHLVDSNGNVNVSFTSQQGGVENRIFATYLKHEQYPEVQRQDTLVTDVPQSPITTWEQNGSYVVDHFSALGAQTTISFWENNLLDAATINLIKQVGNYVWEDSQEFYFFENTFWTPNLPATFLANRGYSVNEYIPLLINTLTTSTSVTLYVTDQPNGGASHVSDYRQTLTEMNQIYLQTLSSWAQNTLGIQFSAQVVYNLPMDMLANVPYVNAPECETLAFLGNIDGYRQFAGPANLAGKRIISSESGAQFYEAYQQPIPQIIAYFKRSMAGGVNQNVIHGYPYSGNYGHTTWPGFTTFDYTVSEMHGRHQPGWDFYSDFLDWTSRTQWVAQTGIPKIDLAFYSKSTDYRSIGTVYSPTDLSEAGFAYEYLSPDNFALPEAYVAAQTFASERQAFKALIVGASELLTGLGVTKLSEYAHAGLPIIFLGGIPSNFEGYDQTGFATANATISSLTSLRNVHVTTPNQGLAAVLSSLNISPRTAISANGTWYTYWREGSSTDYVWVYNDASNFALGQGYSTGSITFETTGIPYIYDAWTGAISPVLGYTLSSTHTTIQLELAGDQTTIIAFQHFGIRPFYVPSLPATTLNASSSSSSISVLSTFTSEASPLHLSNGSSTTLSSMLTPPFTLANWSLTVESWTAPSDLYDLNPVATRTNLSAFTNIQTLVPWYDISSSLTEVSGRGYYSTSFQWPPSKSANNPAYFVTGAYIDLGAIIHTVRVRINGHTLPPLDLTWARADISRYLINGVNEVEVVVSTPLGNALRVIWDSIEIAGKTAASQLGAPSVADYGLVFPVQIVPYREDVLPI